MTLKSQFFTNVRAFPSGVHDAWCNFLSSKSFQQLNSQNNIFRQYFFLYHDFFFLHDFFCKKKIYIYCPNILSFYLMYYYHFISLWGMLLWDEMLLSRCVCLPVLLWLRVDWDLNCPAVPITPLPSQDEACRLHHIIFSSISTPSWLRWSCHLGISQLEYRSQSYLQTRSCVHSPKYDLKWIQFMNY